MALISARSSSSPFWQYYTLILAALILCQLGLGWYMTRLDFYHRWYHAAPDLHKSIGMLIMALVIVRLTEKLSKWTPGPLPFMRSLKKSAYGANHLFINILILLVAFTGYSFATAKGDGISLFGLFYIPPIALYGKEGQALFDRLHFLLAYGAALVILRHSIEKTFDAMRRKGAD
ncbi:MAG: cytochrome b/b6 domain-containing protein [bacterium]|nr:cytochrome b/b6 domain-containing protein [bacterium]